MKKTELYSGHIVNGGINGLKLQSYYQEGRLTGYLFIYLA